MKTCLSIIISFTKCTWHSSVAHDLLKVIIAELFNYTLYCICRTMQILFLIIVATLNLLLFTTKYYCCQWLLLSQHLHKWSLKNMKTCLSIIISFTKCTWHSSVAHDPLKVIIAELFNYTLYCICRTMQILFLIIVATLNLLLFTTKYYCCQWLLLSRMSFFFKYSTNMQMFGLLFLQIVTRY